MKTFFNKIKIVLADSNLRGRIIFTLLALLAFRVLAAVPVPGIDHSQLAKFFGSNEFLGLLNIFSGGGLSQLSIVMLGVGPYITSSIILQLLTVAVPRLKEMYQEEGEMGRRKFAQYGRMLAVPFAVVQGLSFIKILQSQHVIGVMPFATLASILLVITAGSMLLMWIGELITEFGIGNGVSLIIFAGIIAQLPTEMAQLAYVFDPSQIFQYLAFLVIALLVILAVVVVTEAERPIPITYAKQVRGNRVYGGSSTYLPIRVNQSGVMPIIFGVSILSFPRLIAQLLQNSSIVWVKSVSSMVLTVLGNSWVFDISYFVLVVLFTYFYTAVTFEPESISKNLQQGGAFIPGVRPGKSTTEYLAHIVTRLTAIGALFLGFIAVLPLVIKAFTGITAISVGGTALLIVVSVVIDMVKKVDAQASAREY